MSDFRAFKRVFQATGIVDDKERKPKPAPQTGEYISVYLVGAGWRERFNLTADQLVQIPEIGEAVSLVGEVMGSGDKTYFKVKNVKLLGAGGLNEPAPARRAA